MMGGVFLAIGLGCTSTPADPGLLVIVTDGIRGDRMGRPLHSSSVPELSELADLGTRFDRMYATSTSASSTLATVFSGLLPTVHGQRSSAPFNPSAGTDWWFDGTVASFESSPPERWNSLVVSAPTVDPASPVDLRIVGIPMLGRTQTAEPYDAALLEADQRIGTMVSEWRAGHPLGTVVVVGLRGALAEARFDAELGLTDDWLHVPLVMVGPSIPIGWSVSDPVSAVDVGTWFARRVGARNVGSGRNPLNGGSDEAYHESVLGMERFGSVALRGFTDNAGRFVYGTYGEWYAHTDGGVRPYPNPVSNHPQHRETLFAITGASEPETPDSDAIDPRSLASDMTLVHKARRAIERNRVGAATRIIDRLKQTHPQAPVVGELEALLVRMRSDQP